MRTGTENAGSYLWQLEIDEESFDKRSVPQICYVGKHYKQQQSFDGYFFCKRCLLGRKQLIKVVFS